ERSREDAECSTVLFKGNRGGSAEEALEGLLVGEAAGVDAFVVVTGHFEKGFRLVGGCEKGLAVGERDELVVAAVGDEDRAGDFSDVIEVGEFVATELADGKPAIHGRGDFGNADERGFEDNSSRVLAGGEVGGDAGS